MNELQILRRLDDLPADARQWLMQAEVENYEIGLPWFQNLVSTVYDSDPGIRILLLRDASGRLLALLPLQLHAHGRATQASSLANFYTALYQPLLAPALPAKELVPLFHALKREFPRLGRMWLAPMDPHAPAYRTLLQALRLARWLPFEFFAFGNWYTRTPEGGWPAYLASRQGALRSTIKRKGARFARDGGRLETVRTPEALEAVLDDFLTVYTARWKRDEPYPEFMPGLMRTCARLGYLRLGMAWIGEQVVAGQIWIVAHGRAEIYKLAYDEGNGEYSPGSLLTAKLLQEVMEQDSVTEIDYLIGDHAYKKLWMNERRERFGILAYDPFQWRALPGLLSELIARALRPFKKLRTLRSVD